MRDDDPFRTLRRKQLSNLFQVQADAIGGTGGESAFVPDLRPFVHEIQFEHFLLQALVAIEQILGKRIQTVRRRHTSLRLRKSVVQQPDRVQIFRNGVPDALYRFQLFRFGMKNARKTPERAEQVVRERIGILAGNRIVKQNLKQFVIL